MDLNELPFMRDRVVWASEKIIPAVSEKMKALWIQRFIMILKEKYSNWTLLEFIWVPIIKKIDKYNKRLKYLYYLPW